MEEKGVENDLCIIFSLGHWCILLDIPSATKSRS